MRQTCKSLEIFLVLASLSCGGRLSQPGDNNGPGDVPGLADVRDHDPEIATLAPAAVAESPTSPPAANGGALAWAAAPLLAGVQVAAGRDSVMINVPTVANAADFRVFALDKGVVVTSGGGREGVSGADIYCAGNRQFNAPAPSAKVVVQQIEVFGITGPTRLVVEAIDRNCPFPGLRGKSHYTTQVTNGEVPEADRVPITLFTDSELRAAYNQNIYFNGHETGASLAAPAANVDPAVLARTTLLVSPTGTWSPELAYFDDFSNNNDQPVFIKKLPTFSDRNSNAQLLQSNRWSFYQYNYDHTDLMVDRGMLQMTVLDRYQEVFATNNMVARRPVQLSNTDYLHVAFTVNSDSTQRRYWWIFLCGAAAARQTLDNSGQLLGNIVNTPFFYQPDGQNPSVEGWNCLSLFPRDGTPFPLPPSNQRPQSDVRVMINAPRTSSSVVNVGPDQYASVGATGVSKTVYPGWYRQQDAAGKLVAAILDDQMSIAPRARYDLYIRRDRVIMFVNGQQRLCNDFGKAPLTMAEGALGFSQVLYHSTAERLEFSRDFDDRTGQTYYLTNTPYADVRSWDNVGYQEHTRAPSYFDSSVCYVYH